MFRLTQPPEPPTSLPVAGQQGQGWACRPGAGRGMSWWGVISPRSCLVVRRLVAGASSETELRDQVSPALGGTLGDYE